MSRLGYQRYGAQGGDWGSIISRELGLVGSWPASPGVHLNIAHHPAAGRPGRADRGGGPAAAGGTPRSAPPAPATARSRDHAADAGLRPRPTRYGRAAGLDHREVRRVDRQRAAGRGGRPRPAAHQRHAVLADRDVRLVGAAVLRDRAGAGLEPDGPLDGAHRRGRLPAGDRAADPALRRAVTTPSRTGPSSAAAATSRPWRCPTCWSATCASSSGRCAGSSAAAAADAQRRPPGVTRPLS